MDHQKIRTTRQTVDAIAGALRLDAVETAHLYALTGIAPAQGEGDNTVPASVRRMIDRLPTPAYVTNRLGDVLHWNTVTDALFGFADVSGEDRNIYAGMFLHPARASCSARAGSAAFAKWWGLHDINAGGAGSKTLYPPKSGNTKYEYDALQATENPSLKGVIYSEV